MMKVMASVTHKEKLLQLLSDGEPHTHHETYALGIMAHSRAADLRAEGYDVRCWREGANYLYQLALPEGEGTGEDGLSLSGSAPSLALQVDFSRSASLPAGGSTPAPQPALFDEHQYAREDR